MKPVLFARGSKIGQAQGTAEALGRGRSKIETELATLREEQFQLAPQVGRQVQSSSAIMAQAHIERRAGELEGAIKDAEARLARTDEGYTAARGAYEVLYKKYHELQAAHDGALERGDAKGIEQVLADLAALTFAPAGTAPLSPSIKPGRAGRIGAE